MAKYRVFTTSNSGLTMECQDIEARDDGDAERQASSLVKLTNKKVSKIVEVNSKEDEKERSS